MASAAMRISLLVLACALAGVSTQVFAQEAELRAAAIAGKATVLDSDTLAIGGRSFSFDGADGIEFHQFCYVRGQPWACGASAVRALQTLVDPVEVSCRPTGTSDDAGDLAVCTAGGVDIAEAMVSDGWALARGESRLAALQAEARAARRGVWESQFVEPWAYRDQIAAIEARYLDKVAEAVRLAAEAAMTNEAAWVHVLEGYEIVDAAPGEPLNRRQARVTELPAAFVAAAIGERDVFSWRSVADHVSSWQVSAVEAIKADAVGLLWAQLLNQPSITVNAFSELSFYEAMIEHAAAWRDAGRQPVLLVRSPLVPTWIRPWFDDNAPPRANVVHKTSIAAPGYIGTIEGIDIYVGSVPDTASALLPADLLLQVRYGRRADGSLLAMGRTGNSGTSELTADYSVGFAWRDDQIVWLKYPHAETDALFER